MPTDAPHDVALVLGGGGAAGNAWAVGVIAGLAEAGLDMSEAADVVIGTSSGAIGAAQVRSGIPPADLVASVLSPRVQSRGRNRERPAALPVATVFERMRAISAAATSAADLQRAMGGFGLECASILGPRAAQHRGVVAARLPRHEWPARPMIVVAIDAHTGALATFDRDSGVDLVDAITAGTALPGSSPTISINGTRYINGGVRSAENADLASSYANVVVLSPFDMRDAAPPRGDARKRPVVDWSVRRRRPRPRSASRRRNLSTSVIKLETRPLSGGAATRAASAVVPTRRRVRPPRRW